MSKLIDTTTGRTVSPGSPVMVEGDERTMRWFYEPTAYSTHGTVYVSDEDGRVSFYPAEELGLRVVDDSFVPEPPAPAVRIRRVRPGTGART